MISLRETNTYTEIDILLDGQAIGKAEIKHPEERLSNFEIYEPFRHNGYGTEAVKQLIDQYHIKELCVKCDNQKAMRTYIRAGFEMAGVSYWEMVLGGEAQND